LQDPFSALQGELEELDEELDDAEEREEVNPSNHFIDQDGPDDLQVRHPAPTLGSLLLLLASALTCALADVSSEAA
jgi:hypothetical protein